MSMIFFRTRWLCADVTAAEHARHRRLVDDLAWRAIERDCDPGEHHGPSVLRQALPLADWVTRCHGPEFGRTVALYLKTTPNIYQVRLPDRDLNPSSVIDVHRNTVLAGYSDQVALAARLALQLPDNLWIEPGDRAWAADLIDLGRSTPWPAELTPDPSGNRPVFADPCWGHVVELLRADDQDTVVILYRDGDVFPSQIWAGREGENREAAYLRWKQATRDQRWDASEQGLREHAAQFGLPLRLAPDTLHTPAFSPEPDLTWNTVAAAWRNPTHP